MTTDIKTPPQRLKVGDLSLLKSISENASPVQEVTGQRARLHWLGLIDRKSLPPINRKELERELRESKGKAKQLLSKGNWEDLRNLCWTLERINKDLRMAPRWILTDKGKSILKRSLQSANAEKPQTVTDNPEERQKHE